jgi:BirA family transcriptional regulator, biotin operon repressor / biotin---[acetyl-CoA-carboxylase] ligase
MTDSASPPPLDPDILREGRGAGDIGKRVLVFRETSSTNELLLRLGEAGEPHGTAVFAESQTAGRGRFRRAWHSAPGLGLWFSVLLRPEIDPGEMEELTPFAAVSAAEAIRSSGPVDVRIKPPNDLYAGPRKLAGILIETRIGSASFAVMGIGINVNHSSEDFPEKLRQTATSLARETGSAWDRQALAVAVLRSLNEWYPLCLERTEGLSNRYKALLTSAFQSTGI